MKLTDREIKLIKGNGKNQFKLDGNGLYLRVYPSGKKEWRYRYLFNGKQKWFFLGIYPAMTLAEARLKAHQEKANRRNHQDPYDVRAKKLEVSANEQKAKEDEKARLNARTTTNELYKRWFSLNIYKRKDGGLEVKRSFEKDVLPVIGLIPAEEVSKSDIAKIIDACLERGSDRMAKVIFSLLRQLFRFAESKDIVKINPTASLSKGDIGKKSRERERYLEDSEIIELKKKLPDAGLPKASELAIWIQMATGCRIGELVKAKWSDIDLNEKTWTIVPENSKNGKAMKVYLSDFTLSSIKKLKQIQPKSVWVYPNRSNTCHLNTKTITKQIADRQRENVAKLEGRTKNTNALALKNGRWNTHDLRRTAATLMVSLKVMPDIADRCLNHTEENKMRRIYIKHTFESEKKEAWNILGARLALLTNPKTTNLLALEDLSEEY